MLNKICAMISTQESMVILKFMIIFWRMLMIKSRVSCMLSPCSTSLYLQSSGNLFLKRKQGRDRGRNGRREEARGREGRIEMIIFGTQINQRV
jgi:hypothetical protein